MNLNKYIKAQAKKLGKKHLAKQIVKTLESKNIASQEKDQRVNQKNTAEKVFKQNTYLKRYHSHHSHHAADVGEHHTIRTTLDLAIKKRIPISKNHSVLEQNH